MVSEERDELTCWKCIYKVDIVVFDSRICLPIRVLNQQVVINFVLILCFQIPVKKCNDLHFSYVITNKNVKKQRKNLNYASICT